METTLRSGFFCSAFLFGLLILGSIVGTSEASISAIYGLGDSLVDVGENNFINNPNVPRANFKPYGESAFPIPTGRFSNGLLVTDFLCVDLGLAYTLPYFQLNLFPSNPARFDYQNVNFASAGSGILDGTNANEGVINLKAQLAQFLSVQASLRNSLGSNVANDIIRNSIVTINTASNDVSFYFATPALQAQFTIQAYIAELISELAQVINTLISTGVYRILVSGLGPIGCVPQVVGTLNAPPGTCLDSFNEIALAFNANLLPVITGFNTVAKVSFANPYNFVLNLIQNNQGFKHGSTGCCGSGPDNGNFASCGKGRLGIDYNLCPISEVDDYFFWDFIHPTQRANSLLAKQAFLGNTSFIQPLNVYQLSLLFF